MGLGDRKGGLGMGRNQKKNVGLKRDSLTQVCLCVENLNSNGTQGPSRVETLVIRGQRVDDVITNAPTNPVLYIITLPFPPDPLPATTPRFCLVNGSFYL